jgi:hypothetical protein
MYHCNTWNLKRGPLPNTASKLVGDLRIPLELQGIMSGFTTRKPTSLEVNDKSGANRVHVWMTSEASWDPHSTNPGDIESTLWDSLPTPHTTPQLSPLQVRGLEQATNQSEAELMSFYCDLSPDATAKDPHPKLPTSVIQCISTITDTWTSAARDVGSYAPITQ